MNLEGDMFELCDDADDDCSTSHMGHKENPASQLSLTPSVSSLNTEGARTPKAATDPAKQTISEDIKPMTDPLENLNVMPNNQAENQMKNSGERSSLSGFNARSIDTTDIDNDTSSETINTEIAILKKEIEDYRREIEELQNIVDSQRAEISSELDRYQAEADLIEQRIQHAETEILALNEQLVQNERLLAEEKETQADAVAKNLLGIEEESKETQELELRIKNINLDIEDRERLIAHKKVQKAVNQRINETTNCAKEDLVKNEGNLKYLRQQESKNQEKIERLVEELKDNK